MSKITYLLLLGTFLAVGAITYNIYQPLNIEEKKINVPVVNKIKEAKPLLKKDDFVTENLANIYIKQDKIDDAIKIYKKLILINSKKKSYFAKKINDLKK